MPAPILRRAPNRTYYAFWSENRRSHRKSMATDDSLLAQQRFAHWLLTRGAAAPATRYTVRDCWTVYAAKHLPGVVTAAALRQTWKLRLEPHFGDLDAATLAQEAIDAYVAGRAATPATARKELALLIAVLNFAADPRRKMLSAAPHFTLPAAAEPRDRWLRPAEMQRLFRAAAALRTDDRLSRGERFLWIALETAARSEAIRDLTWDRVDFQTNTIHFDVPGRARTTKRRAAVSISSSLRPVLERAYRERLGACVMDHGGSIWHTIQRIAAAADVEAVSPHVFRHTAATAMARAGVPLWKVAKTLGNSLAVVEKSYAKWAPDDPAGTVDLISNGALETVT